MLLLKALLALDSILEFILASSWISLAIRLSRFIFFIVDKFLLIALYFLETKLLKELGNLLNNR